MTKTLVPFDAEKTYKYRDDWQCGMAIGAGFGSILTLMSLIAFIVFLCTSNHGWLSPAIVFGISFVFWSLVPVSMKKDKKAKSQYVNMLGKRKVIIDAISENSYRATVYTFSQYSVTRFGYEEISPDRYHWKQSVSAKFDSTNKAIDWSTDWIVKSDQEQLEEKLEKALEADRQQALKDQRLELDF